jgi:hypothetical protein
MVLAMALFVGGCTEGGTISVPVGFCQEDIDCAPGFTCEHKGFDGTGMCDRRTPEVVCPTPDDAGMPDAGFDAGEVPDSGSDAGEVPDSGEIVDAGALDASSFDAGDAPDASSEDAGEVPDAGFTPDSGSVSDAGETPDSGGVVDAGFDAGVVVEQLRIDNVTVTGVAQGVITVSGDVNREATSVLAVTGLAPKSEVHYKFNHSFTLALLASGNYAYQLVVTAERLMLVRELVVAVVMMQLMMNRVVSVMMDQLVVVVMMLLRPMWIFFEARELCKS